MASAEMLKVTHSVDGKVMGVDDRVKGVEAKIQDVRGDVQDVHGDVQVVSNMVQSAEGRVRGDVQDVGNMVQSVEGRVRGDVQDIHDKVQDVDGRVQGIDDKLDHANRSLSVQPLVIIPRAQTGITGNQLRDNLLRWLSPPDPSTNHNIACKAHHNGTAEWFFRGSIFNQWKTTGSFLWIHGKRALPLAFTTCRPRTDLVLLM
jgi:hypothetical protein